jgi:DNA invertase Pin-like site-specific DNA recombinase
VSKIDRLARSTSDLYGIVSLLAEKGVSFKVIDDPSIDTSSRIGIPKGDLIHNLEALFGLSATQYETRKF